MMLDVNCSFYVLLLLLAAGLVHMVLYIHEPYDIALSFLLPNTIFQKL